MSTSKNRRGSQSAPVLVVTGMILALSLGAAGAQTTAEPQQPSRRTPQDLAYAYATPQTVWNNEAAGQVPQDIRIMQRIVSTALGEVEAPELPDVLQEEAGSPGSPGTVVYNTGGSEPTVWLSDIANRVYSIAGRDVTGFYMQGYGYLFTVKWRVAQGLNTFEYAELAYARARELDDLSVEARRRAAAGAGATAETRAASEAQAALEQERDRVEERQAAWEQWSVQYQNVLADALRDVVALYGSTLKRATPDESITFIADFGGEEADTVTVSARRGDLTGASREENLAAVQMAKGEMGVSGTLRTELKILAEIIDSAVQVQRTDDVWTEYNIQSWHSGGSSSYQYVPGYGVLFSKAARLNMATQVLRQVNPDRRGSGVTVATLSQQIDESTEEQRQAYAEHLADLKTQTAEILATYGPTLTEMNDDDWVGVFYDVGSAAGLLEGGITNFLVQARMGDIRQAGNEADGAAWLLDFLVTNEKRD